jgi:hypothetical protein
VDGPVSDTFSGIQTAGFVPAVLSVILKYESVYPEGRVQETVAPVPAAVQEDVWFVGVGIASEHDAFVPPFAPLHIQVQLGELSALLALVPARQL